eukprot:TRINITY_DN10053_c0_g1_i3.p1 TRINITY_DN10053_c0_g1~~TRINITY_DN10053_c0_g1_i3.p1  ORF type:complete len:118 (-),score=42.26 TRINITY_DN10053_c0_g1_i3:41-394(-)
MNIAGVEEEAVWFFTHRNAPKTDEIKEDQKVALSLQSPNSYIFASGSAKLIKDQQKINKLWKDEYKAWFPKDTKKEDISLIKVIPKDGEYWDYTSGTGILSYMLGSQPKGENEKVQM